MNREPTKDACPDGRRDRPVRVSKRRRRTEGCLEGQTTHAFAELVPCNLDPKLRKHGNQSATTSRGLRPTPSKAYLRHPPRLCARSQSHRGSAKTNSIDGTERLIMTACLLSHDMGEAHVDVTIAVAVIVVKYLPRGKSVDVHRKPRFPGR